MVGQVEGGGLPQRKGPGGGEKLRHELGAEVAALPAEGEVQQAERHPHIAIVVVGPAGGHGPEAGLHQAIGPVGHRDPVAAAGGDAAAAELVGGLLREAPEGEAVKAVPVLQADGGMGVPLAAEAGQHAGEAIRVFGEQYAQVFHRAGILFLMCPARHLLPYRIGILNASLWAPTAGKPLQNKDFPNGRVANLPQSLAILTRLPYGECGPARQHPAAKDG